MSESGPRVLVVDDEPAIRRFLRTSLAAHSHIVLEAATGAEALLAVASLRPDLVILDLGLPDLDGIEVTRRLREWTQVPIIILTVQEQEHLRAVILDSKNHVVKVHTVYVGSLNTAVVRVGELFREAIRLNAAAVIIAHNHPSGDPTPSPEDVHVTRQIVEAGKLLNIDVLDHLVICQARWVSLKERGLGF